MIKILCLVSHGLYKPWLEIFENGQKVTWLAKDLPANFEIAHFHGTPVGSIGATIDRFHEKIRWSNRPLASMLRAIDRALSFPFKALIPKTTISNLLQSKQPVWHVHQPDLYCTYKWKEIGVMSHVLQNYEFDFLFTTTTSSYIKPEILLKVMEEKPKQKYYGGMIPYEDAQFASGSNRIFSRDVVELLVENRKQLDSAVIEDVSIADLLRKMSIYPDPLFGMNLDSREKIESLSPDSLAREYHYRLKSGPLSERKDVELFKVLDDKFK